MATPFLSEEESHVKAKWVEGLHNSPYFSCPHGLALTPGLLPVNFTASYIFNFIINTSLYLHQPALEWCVAVYSICFIPAALAILLNLGEWEYRLPRLYPIFQLLLTTLSVLLYISALVLWLLYQFYEEFGGQPQRPSDGDCRDELTYNMCVWDQRLVWPS